MCRGLTLGGFVEKKAKARRVSDRLVASEADWAEWDALKAEVRAELQAEWEAEKAEKPVEEAKEVEEVNLEQGDLATIPYPDTAPDTVKEEAEEVEEWMWRPAEKKTGKKRSFTNH